MPAGLVLLADRKPELVQAQNVVPLYRRNELGELGVTGHQRTGGVLDTAALRDMRQQVASVWTRQPWPGIGSPPIRWAVEVRVSSWRASIGRSAHRRCADSPTRSRGRRCPNLRIGTDENSCPVLAHTIGMICAARSGDVLASLSNLCGPAPRVGPSAAVALRAIAV